MGKQSSQYDKILKENLEAIIPGLMENILNIRAVSSEELPDDVQHTKERKPDVLKKITDDQGEIYVLQLEFQVADEPDMVYRMAEYYIMLERKYRLPVRQFVIFLGSATPQMTTQLDRPNLIFNFSLISFATLDYRLFLRSDRPEDVLLSVLANLMAMVLTRLFGELSGESKKRVGATFRCASILISCACWRSCVIWVYN